MDEDHVCSTLSCNGKRYAEFGDKMLCEYEESRRQRFLSFVQEIPNLKKEDRGHRKLLNDIEELYDQATRYHFHDFKREEYSLPKQELREKLNKISRNVINGLYDNLND